MPKYVLIGLCEPVDESGEAAFDEWFIQQHIEDTARCPNFVSGKVFALRAPHLDIETATRYLSLYEVEADSHEEAERVLNEWQADADAWPGRATHNATRQRFGQLPMKIGGSGWYELLRAYDGNGERTD